VAVLCWRPERLLDLRTEVARLERARQFWMDQAEFIAGYNKVKAEVAELERMMKQ
jgi:hypothetical protein